MPRDAPDTAGIGDERASRSEPESEDRRDSQVLDSLRRAFADRVQTERVLVAAVSAARDAGYTWKVIGDQLGTSGEAARQRYSRLVAHRLDHLA